MKLNDAVIGAALVALGLFILWHIQGFPAMPGQKFGPAWFPGIAAAGLAICGGMLVVQGVRSGQQWLVFDEWTRRKRPVAGFASVVAGLGFYVVASNPLGFHLTGLVLMLAWLRVLGARWSVAMPVAILAPIVIHLAFYKLLRIPLPWGVLEPFAF
ncbi:MAG: tripartite tricarboxylate transporter TctB family protein [Gemmatimonadales bacterium]